MLTECPVAGTGLGAILIVMTLRHLRGTPSLAFGRLEQPLPFCRTNQLEAQMVTTLALFQLPPTPAAHRMGVGILLEIHTAIVGLGVAQLTLGGREGIFARSHRYGDAVFYGRRPPGRCCRRQSSPAESTAAIIACMILAPRQI